MKENYHLFFQILTLAGTFLIFMFSNNNKIAMLKSVLLIIVTILIAEFFGIIKTNNGFLSKTN